MTCVCWVVLDAPRLSHLRVDRRVGLMLGTCESVTA